MFLFSFGKREKCEARQAEMVGILAKPSTTYFVAQDTQSRHFHVPLWTRGCSYCRGWGRSSSPSAVIIEVDENVKKGASAIVATVSGRISCRILLKILHVHASWNCWKRDSVHFGDEIFLLTHGSLAKWSESPVVIVIVLELQTSLSTISQLALYLMDAFFWCT